MEVKSITIINGIDYIYMVSIPHEFDLIRILLIINIHKNKFKIKISLNKLFFFLQKELGLQNSEMSFNGVGNKAFT